jgi:hypothetical protein
VVSWSAFIFVILAKFSGSNADLSCLSFKREAWNAVPARADRYPSHRHQAGFSMEPLTSEVRVERRQTRWTR